MKIGLPKITIILLLALLFGVATTAAAQGRRAPQFAPDTRVGGKLSAVNGNTLTVTNRQGEAQTLRVTADTKYLRNREAASLSAFQTGDFIAARGAKDASGVFVAEQVFGGDKPPQGGPGGRGPRGPRDGIIGDYVSADTSAGSITIKTRDGKEQTVYTSESTEISRNRSDASLGDFKAGDQVAAFGKLDATTGRYVAVRVRGGDAAPPRKP
jgi:Cu/Ag efflux protein CusF